MDFVYWRDSICEEFIVMGKMIGILFFMESEIWLLEVRFLEILIFRYICVFLKNNVKWIVILVIISLN